MPIRPITEAEFHQHRRDYDGVCFACGEWTSGGCEPDAERYRCEACGADEVHGCEQALILLRLEITE